MTRTTRFSFSFLVALSLISNGTSAEAQGKTSALPEYESVTTKDPLVPKEELKWMVMPLTKDELNVEAQAWLQLVKEKAKKIAAAELGNIQINKQVDKAQAAEKAAEKSQEAIEVAKVAQANAASGNSDEAADAERATKEAEAATAKASAAVAELEAEKERAASNAEVKAVVEETVQKIVEKEAQEKLLEEGTTPEADKVAPTPPGETTQAKAVSSDVAALQDTAERAKETQELKAEEKTKVLEGVNELREERVALVDRARLVLAELETKGGEIEEMSKYLTAVSEVKVDVTDTVAVWVTITGWLKSSEGGLRWSRNIAIFVATVFGFWVLALIAGLIAERTLRVVRNLSQLMREFLGKSVRYVVLSVGIIIALSALEVDVAPLLAMIGAAGFIIAFALQDTLGNFASGIMILLYRPFDVGDIVDTAGVSGKVVSLNLVSVTINTVDNKTVVVPNNAIWGDVITNSTGSAMRRVDLSFGIGYDDDVERAERLLTSLVESHELVLKFPEPIIKLHELADSSVNFVVRPWCKTEDYWTVYWDITKAVKMGFDANGISIPFPQRDVHVHTVKAEVEKLNPESQDANGN